MVESMTGFGRGRASQAGITATVEIKCVNSRNLELNVRLPRHYFEQEMTIRTAAGQRLQRGKVSLVLTVENPGATPGEGATVDRTLLVRLLTELKLARELSKLGAEPDPALLLQVPGVLIESDTAVSDAEWAVVEKALAQALDATVASRRTEGKALEADLRLRIAAIQALSERISPFEAERIAGVKQRLAANLAEWTSGLSAEDPRFQQELIYYLERNDITEERVRLDAHLKLFTTTLDAAESQGRKLAFIGQEIGREINTLGAKAYHSGLQALVVEMKDELEKIKEQLNNLL